MTDKTLTEMIESAKNITMTPEQAAEQRRSFVYGNCKIENDDITREIVDEADRKLQRDGECVDQEKAK